VLRSGRVALGVGLPFGHSDAEALQRLLDAARSACASGLRTAPGRALLVLGLLANKAQSFAAEAASFGFIVEADDPRRRVIACAGAPICAAGEIPARAMAPAIARALSATPRAAGLVHVSGCAKGCAHPAAAPVAIFGRAGACDLFIDGALSCSVTVAAAPERIGQIMRSRVEMAHG
jgi:precorrin-3B synthase